MTEQRSSDGNSLVPPGGRGNPFSFVPYTTGNVGGTFVDPIGAASYGAGSFPFVDVSHGGTGHPASLPGAPPVWGGGQPFLGANRQPLMYVYGSSPPFNYPVDVLPMAPPTLDIASAPAVCTPSPVSTSSHEAKKNCEPVDLRATLNAIQSTLSPELQPHVVTPHTQLPPGQPFCPVGVIPTTSYAAKVKQ